MLSLCISFDINVAVNNIQLLNVAMQMGEWVPNFTVDKLQNISY